MAQQNIDLGTTANDGTGDALRSAFGKIQDNTTELYGFVAAKADAATTTTALAGKFDKANVDTDSAMAADSNVKVPSQKAVKAALDGKQSVTGAWAAYTPSVSAGSGSFTSVSATGAYLQMGKTVFVRLHVNITTNGSAAGSVSAGLPVTPKSGVFQSLFGTEANVTAKTLQGIISGSVAIIRNLDATYPGGNGYSLNLNGSYEAD